jgi:hypothetical protein
LGKSNFSAIAVLRDLSHSDVGALGEGPGLPEKREGVSLPEDPTVRPAAFGGPGRTTLNFELRPTFWFGLTL